MQSKVEHSNNGGGESSPRKKRRVEEELRMSRVQDERERFCKMILEKEPMQQLAIPPEFLRLYHGELPDTVIFKGPSGNEWPARLCKENDFMYVQDDGWRNFHRDNALGNSEFLIFQYDGKNCFEVQVFDPTGVERLNVTGAKSTETNNPSGHRPRGSYQKHPLFGSENLPPSKSPNSHGKHNPEPEQNKLEKIQVEESPSKIKEEEMDLPDVRMSSEPGKHKNKNKQRQVKAGKLAPHLPDCKLRSHRHSLEKNFSSSKENARLRAVKENFSSDFPFFMTYMRRSRMEKVKPLLVPSELAKKHFTQQRANVVLRNAQGKTWEVVCLRNAKRRFFSGGWPAFVHDNELKIGDVCIFELLNKKEVRVHIYRSLGTLAI